ncbi:MULTISPECIES: hypothetical protein [Bacteroides]|nr:MULTISPECIES: hypothetical protein [Bacteroides]MCR8895127.1 hypothetical protein [Bacteroides sp. ET336]MCU6772708.1 hypothetical protein [Bacteroides cellulolyticus]MDN0059623.1 hypothetical protein [Bacteroides caecigallinarum]
MSSSNAAWPRLCGGALSGGWISAVKRGRLSERSEFPATQAEIRPE